MYRYMGGKKGGKDAGKQKEKEKKSLRRGTPIFFFGGGEFGDRDPLFYFNFNFKSLYEKQPIIED